MKKRTAKIDWKIDDESAWQTSQNSAADEAPVQSGSTTTALRRKELLLATLFAALLPLLIGGWFWQRAAPAKGGLNELSTRVIQDEQPLTRTLELQNSSLRVDKLQRFGDRIMVQVTVNYQEEGKLRAYRETRFLAKRGDEWLRIAPDSTLTGAAKTLKIAHFTILYRAVDADAVYEAAPKLEQLYATLRQDFGLPTTGASHAYTIEVETGRVQNAINYDFNQRKLTISSPILLSAPVEITPGALVYQALIYPLAHLLIHEAINQHDARWKYNFARWSSIENALVLWELWEDGGPLTFGRAEVVGWLYENGKSATAPRPLPAGYDSLCRTYQIWRFMPLDLSIPLTCTVEDKALPSSQYPSLASTWLRQTAFLGEGLTHQTSSTSATLTAETIIEYIVETHGRHKLPQFIAALGEYDSAATLIPALFGVSQPEFEADWQAYLAGHY